MYKGRKTTRSAHAVTALRTVGIESFRINLPAGPTSVIGTDCHPVTSGMSERLRVCWDWASPEESEALRYISWGEPATGRPVDWKYGDSLRDGGVLMEAISLSGALGRRIPVDSMGGDWEFGSRGIWNGATAGEL